MRVGVEAIAPILHATHRSSWPLPSKTTSAALLLGQQSRERNQFLRPPPVLHYFLAVFKRTKVFFNLLVCVWPLGVCKSDLPCVLTGRFYLLFYALFVWAATIKEADHICQYRFTSPASQVIVKGYTDSRISNEKFLWNNGHKFCLKMVYCHPTFQQELLNRLIYFASDRLTIFSDPRIGRKQNIVSV